MLANSTSRVLYIAHTTTLYGANRSLIDLIDGIRLLDPAFTVAVVIPAEGPIVQELNVRNIQYKVIPYHWSMSERPWGVIRRAKAVIKEIINVYLALRNYGFVKRFDPDLIHSNSGVLNFGAYVARLHSIPHVWHLREFGKSDYGLHYNLGESYFYFWLKKATSVIAISRAIYQYFDLHQLPGARVVYNGVRFSRQLNENEVRTHKGTHDPFVFLMVGLIKPSKNQLEGVMAFEQVARPGEKVKMILVGDSADEHYGKAIQTYVDKHQLRNRVEFASFVHRQSDIYRHGDCFLMCSKMEAMGRVTVEAMSYGLPVIGLRSGATPELITHGFNGLLYDSVEELRDFMLRLSQDRMYSKSLGQNARKTVKEKYVIEKYAENCLQVYASI